MPIARTSLASWKRGASAVAHVCTFQHVISRPRGARRLPRVHRLVHEPAACVNGGVDRRPICRQPRRDPYPLQQRAVPAGSAGRGGREGITHLLAPPLQPPLPLPCSGHAISCHLAPESSSRTSGKAQHCGTGCRVVWPQSVSCRPRAAPFMAPADELAALLRAEVVAPPPRPPQRKRAAMVEAAEHGRTKQAAGIDRRLPAACAPSADLLLHGPRRNRDCCGSSVIAAPIILSALFLLLWIWFQSFLPFHMVSCSVNIPRQICRRL